MLGAPFRTTAAPAGAIGYRLSAIGYRLWSWRRSGHSGPRRPPAGLRSRRRSSSQRAPQEPHEVPMHDPVDILQRVAALAQQRGESLKIGDRLDLPWGLLGAEG